MIDIKSLAFTYPKQKPLFEHLNLSLETGHICGLLGKNGAGKTSLLKLIAGLLFPEAGTIDVMHHRPEKREAVFLEHLYFLPDAFTLPRTSMKHFVAINAPFYTQFDKEVFQKVIDDFELEEVRDLTTLSHGQQKKFLLAFGFATQVPLILLDEPSNGLDIPSKKQLRKLLAAYLESDRTVLISTHQVKDIEHLIDSVLMLDDGEVAFSASCADIQKHLLFSETSRKPAKSGCFYAEKAHKGYRSVKENPKHEVSEIDLELLFNSILENKDAMRRYFEEVSS